MENHFKPDNPTEIAELFAQKYSAKGYVLDFSVNSLETNIDLILENEPPKNLTEREIMEAELTAYFGETICRIFKAEWQGYFTASISGLSDPYIDNYYTCRIKKDEFEFSPSHFFAYYLSNGKDDTGTFKNYLHFSYYYRGDQKFIEDGLLKKLQ